MDLSAERPPTPVAMMREYGREQADAVEKHTTLDSVELLRQRKRELEEQIHQHTEHLRMPVKASSMLQPHSQVRVIHHEHTDDDDYSASSASSWGDTNAGGGTTVGPDTTVGPETTVGGAASSCAQGTSAAPKPKLSSFLHRAEHRVQVNNEVSSVSCSEFGDSYYGEDVSMHDSVSTYHIPTRAVMNLLLQQQSSDDDDDDEEGKDEEDWNPNDEADLRQQQHQRQRQERRTSAASSTPKRVVDTSTLGVFVPSIKGNAEATRRSSDAHHSVTNASAATTTSCSTTDDDVEVALRQTSNKNKPVSSAVVPSRKTPSKAHDDQNDPTLGSGMEDDITTITKHDRHSRPDKTKCIIVSVVIVVLLIIVVALLALIGVMLRNSLRHS